MITNKINIKYSEYISNEIKIHQELCEKIALSLIRCPVCNSKVVRHGEYERKLIISDVEIIKINILQVRCINEECRKVHAVLPNFIIPKKQYARDIISETIKNPKIATCSADDSTIRRWKRSQSY